MGENEDDAQTVRRCGGRRQKFEIWNRLDGVRKAAGEGAIEISLKSHQRASKMPFRRGGADSHGMVRDPCSGIHISTARRDVWLMCVQIHNMLCSAVPRSG